MLSVIKKALRIPVLFSAKYLGLFRLSRLLTRRGLRILCYHGGALADEHLFSPGTFMAEATFRRRMDFLARHEYPVLGLEGAIAGLDAGTLPDFATVITIDDGWFGTYAKLVPVLKSKGFPATIYVTTYYAVKETQVFNMIVGYLLWRGMNKTIELARIDQVLDGSFVLGDSVAAEKAFELIMAHAETALDATGRQKLVERISKELGIQHECALSKGLFRLVDRGQIAELVADGIDIQLHTHRHRLPGECREEVEREIRDNVEVLEPIAGKRLVHFCYPSGKYDASHLAWLEALGVRTATTIEAGFNYPDTPRLLLRRFLDGETISDIEFEAELCGFLELVRRVGISV